MNINSTHLLLFATLIEKSRLSIRGSNPNMEQWVELRDLGLCSILESGRRGTLVIHHTMKAHGLAESFIDMLN